MPVITRELENVELGVSVSIEGLLDGVDYKGLRGRSRTGMTLFWNYQVFFSIFIKNGSGSY
jgi:hypothetical protein